MPSSRSTIEHERRFGIGTPGVRLRDGDDELDVWPEPWRRKHWHPYHDCKQLALDFEAEQELARDAIAPKHKAFGDERDDPGRLALYEKHRIVEREVADKLYYELVPYAEDCGFQHIANRARKLALKMYQCRTSGQLGLVDGKPIFAWDTKCSHAKLCPDEARHEGRRMFDHYADHVDAHIMAGGRVYIMWPTLPNYPGGRLREGMNHLPKRWRDKIIRAKKNGKPRFPHVGSLVIVENPLSADREWNVHGNVIMLTSGFLSYEAMRDAWGCNIKMEEFRPPKTLELREKSMANLFNEMVKYSLRSVPEKSDEKARRHETDAPPLVDWTPAELLEWFQACHRYRRTRSFGSLHQGSAAWKEIPSEKPIVPKPRRWLGRLDYQDGNYRVTWRKHNLAYLAKEMQELSRADLILIRGDNSTTRAPSKYPTGPP